MKIFYRLIIYVIDALGAFPHKIRYFCFKKLHDIHPDFKFNGPRSRIYGDGLITIGQNSYCGEGAFLLTKGTGVYVGTNHSIFHDM
jgi:hypothetical protein